MTTAIDTNILSTLFSAGPNAPAISAKLLEARSEGALIVSGVVYAELLAGPHITQDVIGRLFSQTGIQAEFALTEDVWTTAGMRYGQYAARRRASLKEGPRRLVADFLIGAHALLRTDRLMTLDSKWYQQDFPELRLYPLGI